MMSDPSRGTAPSTEGADLTAGLPGALDRPVSSLTAPQAVQRIHTWHTVLRTLSATAEREIMEAAWIIRREYPERGDFVRFVDEQGLTVSISADRVWIAAETWEVARRQRSLREMTATRPEDAMQFVADIAAAAGDAGLKALDDEDRDVIGLLAQPARKRRAAIRTLIESQRAVADGRHPADVEHIRTLTAERDEALAEAERTRTVVPMADTSVGHVMMLHREASELLGKLTEVAAGFEAFMEGEPPPGERSTALENAVAGMTRLADDVSELGERISAAAFGETTD